MSGWQKELTIIEALNKIDSNELLLPAIQREFVWSKEQIERLFDSILLGYPINSFMFWNISSEENKDNLKFYRFLKDYKQYDRQNPEIPINSYKNDFYAVIDGQQRLNAIYIGLNGSYAEHVYKRSWKNHNDWSYPPRQLYLNMDGLDDEGHYQFKFLTTSQNKAGWFLVNDIFKNQSLLSTEWSSNNFAQETIEKLKTAIFETPLINFYLETEQSSDKILDIFVRTNSGGTQLTYMNLLQSMIINQNTIDLRQKLPEIRKIINDLGFQVSNQFILKASLYLLAGKTSIKLANFDQSFLALFDNKWPEFQQSLISVFEVLSKLGFKDSEVRNKNAVLPIAYWVYNTQTASSFVKDKLFLQEKHDIKRWLYISALTKFFRYSGDSALKRIRRIVQEQFSFDAIKTEFRGDPNRNLSIDIEWLLTLPYGWQETGLVLRMITKTDENSIYHQDHIFPKKYFLENASELSELQQKIWNTLPNLQLLSENLTLIIHDSNRKARQPHHHAVAVLFIFHPLGAVFPCKRDLFLLHCKCLIHKGTRRSL